MKKTFILVIFAVLCLMGCSSNVNESGSGDTKPIPTTTVAPIENGKIDDIILNCYGEEAIPRYMYYNPGPLSSNHYTTKKSNFNTIISRFSDLVFARTSEHETFFGPSLNISFYEMEGKTINFDFEIMMKNDFIFISTVNEGNDVYYSADINEDYYTDLIKYIRDNFNILGIFSE